MTARRGGLLVALIVIALYVPTLAFELVWDDQNLISGSRFLHEASLSDLFSHPFWQTEPGHLETGRALYYRPVVTTSLMLEWRLGGGRVWLLRLSNVLVNALVAVLVYVAARRLLGHDGWALAAGILFAVHPAHTESVAFVVGRTDLLCTALILASILVFDRARPSALRVAVGTGLMLLAALAKEQGFLFPALYAAWGALARPATGGEFVRIRRRLLALQVGALGALLVTRFLLFRGVVGGAAAAYGFGERLPLVLATVGGYLRRLFWPLPHSAYHHLERADIGSAAIAGGFVVAAVIALAFAQRRQPAARLGWVWVAITLGPVANLMTVPASYLAERQLYLPSVGFAWAIGSLAQAAASRFGARRVAILGAVIAVLAVVDVGRRSQVWRDPEAFYRQMIVDSPASIVGPQNLATHYLATARPAAAIPLARAATTLGPEVPQAWATLGRAYLASGAATAARAPLARATELAPSVARYWAWRGRAALDSGDFGAARAALDRAAELAPGLPETWRTRARWHGLKGDYPAAAAAAEQALAVDPGDPAALRHLGAAQLLMGAPERAIPTLRRARAADPGSPEVLFNLVEAHRQQSEPDEMRAALITWLQQNPASPAAAQARQALAELAP